MGMADIPLLRRSAWLFSQLTSAFNGKRNLYDVFGYTTNPTFHHRFAKYLRQDIAARVVDAPATALWTNPPQISSTNEEWNNMWDDLVARQNIFANIERADRLAGIGRYSILLLGFNDGAPLNQPVNTRSLTQRSGPKILYIQPYSEASAKIKKFDEDPTSDNFMKPLIYEIQPITEFVIGFDTKSTLNNPPKHIAGRSTFEVHASRVVHIAENCLENVVFGSPRLERVYNILDDILKVTGGSAETFWLTANRGLHIDVDKEMDLAPSDASDLAEEIDEYQHQLRRVIRTRGTKVSAIGSDTPDPSGVFKVLVAVLSGATCIPQRILLGSEAGQLASEQDRANWADRIDERRANFGNPIVLFQLIKCLTRAGYFPRVDDIEITIHWPSSFKMSPLENAQTSAQHARSATNFAKAIETMENLKRGEPGSADITDPTTGKTIPGKPAVDGIDLPDLVTVDEARKMIGLDKPEVTFDSGADISGNKPKNMTAFRLKVTQGSVIRV